MYNPHEIQIGPNGGKFADTSYIDDAGRPIYQRIGTDGKPYSDYFVLDEATGKQLSVSSPRTLSRAEDIANGAASLHRPHLRNGLREEVYQQYRKLPDGSYMHIKEGTIVQPPIHIGHRYGWENKRILRAAEELGMSQPQLNDYINSRPQHFRLENAMDNMSHLYEKPGIDGLGNIKNDMQNFLRTGK